MPAELTCRERLLRFLDHRAIDRVPMWLLFPYHPTGYYVDVRRHPDYRRVFEASKHRAVMLNRRSLTASVFAPSVTVEAASRTVDGVTVTRRSYRYQHLELFEEHREGVRTRPLLSTDEDLQTLAQMPIETDPARLRAALEQQLPAYLAERKAFPADYGAMMLDLGEPINFLYFNADLATYTIWSLTHAPWVESILDRLFERLKVIYAFALERHLAEVYFMVGSELASPPMVSHAIFERWVVAYASRLIRMIHDGGGRVIQHYHGQIAGLLPGFVQMGADALHTIEEPPVGNCTLESAFDTVADRLGLIGCIQYDCFRSFTPQQMADAVCDQLQRLRGKRFMLSPSAGPYEAQPDPRVFENYLAFLDAGWRYGELD